MIGAGLIKDMSNKLKDNSSLRRRKPLFDVQKESFRSKKSEKTPIDKADPEQLAFFREKAKREQGNGITRAILKAILILLGIGGLGIVLITLTTKAVWVEVAVGEKHV